MVLKFSEIIVNQHALLELGSFIKSIVDDNKLWKIFKDMGIPDHLSCLLKICIQVMKQQLKLNMEKQIGSKSENEYVKAVYCQLAYLTYMQSTS